MSDVDIDIKALELAHEIEIAQPPARKRAIIQALAKVRFILEAKLDERDRLLAELRRLLEAAK